MKVAVLLVGFATCVGLRVIAGGDDVARSITAGLVFAVGLLVLAAAARTRVPVTRRAVVLGLLGIVLVCAPVAIEELVTLRPLRGTTGFVPWAAAVTVVAVAEEIFLRGTLYDAVLVRRGVAAAIGLTALCFALLHVPLYGWHVVPLDLAVGIVLGGLRHEAGTAAAPAITHAGADYVGWFFSAS